MFDYQKKNYQIEERSGNQKKSTYNTTETENNEFIDMDDEETEES